MKSAFLVNSCWKFFKAIIGMFFIAPTLYIQISPSEKITFHRPTHQNW